MCRLLAKVLGALPVYRPHATRDSMCVVEKIGGKPNSRCVGKSTCTLGVCGKDGNEGRVTTTIHNNRGAYHRHSRLRPVARLGGTVRAYSSGVRAPVLHTGGRWFETSYAHHPLYRTTACSTGGVVLLVYPLVGVKYIL